MKLSIRRKGFTLLEILLVIAAIGILAAIVLVAINPTRQISQVRNAQRRSDINTIYKALEQYLIDNKSYPTGIGATSKAICNTGSNSINEGTVSNECIDLRALVPDYLAAIPIDPNGGVYEAYINPDNNRIAVEAPGVELGLSLAVNPIVSTPTSSPTPSLGITSCPTGYIPVPGNSLYDTNNFCVMKYEAKAVSTSDLTVGLLTPVTSNVSNTEIYNTIDNNITATTSANSRAIASIASGYPIARIDQITSAQYCTDAGASLISNDEWMTIARNIEAQGANWTGGAVGSAGLWRGHSDNSPGTGLEASTEDTLGYTGTGDTSPSIQKRTHTLSNGETIWDLSGNVWEWTDDTILGKDQPTGSTAGFTYREFTALTTYGSLSYDLVRPSNNTWNSSQNMGQIYSDGTSTNNTNYAFLRGGHWRHSPTAVGVFALYLGDIPSFKGFTVGFRCVIR